MGKKVERALGLLCLFDWISPLVPGDNELVDEGTATQRHKKDGVSFGDFHDPFTGDVIIHSRKKKRGGGGLFG